MLDVAAKELCEQSHRLLGNKTARLLQTIVIGMLVSESCIAYLIFIQLFGTQMKLCANSLYS